MKKTRKKYNYKQFDNIFLSSEIFNTIKIFKRKKQIARFFPVSSFNLDKISQIEDCIFNDNYTKNSFKDYLDQDKNLKVDENKTQVFIHIDYYLNSLICYSFIKNIYKELKNRDCSLADNVKRDIWTQIKNKFELDRTPTLSHKLDLSFTKIYFILFNNRGRLNSFSTILITRSYINRVLKRVYLNTVQGVQDLMEHIELYLPLNNKVNQCFISGFFFRANDTQSFYKKLDKLELIRYLQINKIPAFSCEPLNNDSELYVNKRYCEINHNVDYYILNHLNGSDNQSLYCKYISSKKTFVFNTDIKILNKYPSVNLTSNNNNLRVYDFKVHENLPKATLPYEKDRLNNIYLGVELECNKTARCPRTINKMLEEEILTGTAIVKMDGSLGSRGLEINVVPMTLDYAKATDYYFNLEKRTKDYLSSYSDSSTGIHIHVGRDILSNYQVGLLGQFVNKLNNYEYITYICGRELNTHEENGQDFARTNPNNNAVKFAKQEIGKYTAVNTLHDETIEFRIFKGNMSAKTIYRYLEFIHGLVSCVKSASLNHKTKYTDFIKYISENKSDYPILHNHHVKKYIPAYDIENKKIETFTLKYKKRFKGIEFDIPKVSLATPLRVRTVRAINPYREPPQQQFDFINPNNNNES